jgi:hypothetical protein
VSGVIGGSGIAGGLFTHEDLIEGTVTLGGLSQGTPDMLFGFELAETSGPGPGPGPSEVLGANVYRDGELIAEMVQDTTYTDPDVMEGYHDYCVTFVYEEGAESCFGDPCVEVLVTEDCQVPVNLTAEVEGDNLVNLAWNQEMEVEFRYDDGTATGQLGFNGGTINSVLGAKHMETAELTEMSWYLTAEGGPHPTVQIYVFGLTSAGLPDGNNVLYTASVSNVDLTWNTHTFPETIMADGGFFLAVAFNGFVGLGTDDGIGEPWVFQNNTHYYSSDYTTNVWSTWESAAFPFNGTIRAMGMVDVDAVPSYVVNNEPVVVQNDPSLAYIALAEPIHTGEPAWANDPFNATREFLGYNIYKDGDLMVEHWMEETYSYTETYQGVFCYTVTADYEYCGETGPSNEACVDILVGISELAEGAARLYPNPARDQFTIEASQMQRITVMNAIGQVVYDAEVNDLNRTILNAQTYQSGVYTVRIMTADGLVTKRVAIVK